VKKEQLDSADLMAHARFRADCGKLTDATPPVGQDGGVFTDLRGNAPPVCLAQPAGLGSIEGQPKGQRPDHLHD